MILPWLSAYLGHGNRRPPPTGISRQHRSCCPWEQPARISAGWRCALMPLIAPTLRRSSTDRRAQHRQGSLRTTAAYWDEFIDAPTGKLPSQLDCGDLDATAISGFLTHLETTRGNNVRTRNVRLTEIRSLFSYAALRHPEHALLIQRVLPIPEALRQAHDVPDPVRDRRHRRGAGPFQMGKASETEPWYSWPSRRAAGFRVHGPELRRCHVGHRCGYRCEGTPANRRLAGCPSTTDRNYPRVIPVRYRFRVSISFLR